MTEQPSIPMIIVVACHSSSRTGCEVATKLSKYFKYSLINPDDVAPALQSFLPSSSNHASSSPKDLDNLSFKIIYQIASVQLRSKLGVVITLSNLSQFDQLQQLANFEGVKLLFIRCRSPDEIVEEGVAPVPASGDDIVGVKKFTVDTDEPFDVKAFVSENLPDLVFPKVPVPEGQIPKVDLVKTSSIGPRHKLTEKTDRHLHRLSFNSKPRENMATLHCKYCRKLVSSGPVYQCVVCDEYIFHKACAETGDLGKIGESDPGLLKAKGHRCLICQRDNKDSSSLDDCHDCLLEANLEGKFLPMVLNHETHSHPLNLIIMPNSYNYEFICCGCGEFGKSISYRCYDCNFNLHVSCLLLPRVIQVIRHMHPLSLVHDSLRTDSWDKKTLCYGCRKETDPAQWFYYCAMCALVFHVGCAFQTKE